MNLPGARVPSSLWSSARRVGEDRERGSQCSDSWSSCSTSGKDSGYRDGRGGKADRQCLQCTVIYSPLSSSCLFTPLSSPPLLSLKHLIQASLTLIHSRPRTHQEQALTHAAEISISHCCCCCNPCAFKIQCV